MKRFLMCLALLLVPTMLYADEACPNKTCQGGACVVAEEPMVVTTVDELVAQTLKTMDEFAKSAYEGVNNTGREAGQLFMEVQFATEDQEVIKRIGTEFERAQILFQVGMEDAKKGGTLAMLATLDEGPEAAALRLQAAAYFASSGGKFLRAKACLETVVKESQAVLAETDVKDPI